MHELDPLLKAQLQLIEMKAQHEDVCELVEDAIRQFPDLPYEIVTLLRLLTRTSKTNLDFGEIGFDAAENMYNGVLEELCSPRRLYRAIKRYRSREKNKQYNETPTKQGVIMTKQSDILTAPPPVETPITKKRTLVQKFAPGLIAAATLATVIIAVKGALDIKAENEALDSMLTENTEA